MSDFYSCDMPTAFKQKNRKARKQHKCCECHHEINIGEHYEYSSGIWDGEPSSYKTCASCVEVRDIYVSLPENETCCFGELACEISDSYFCEWFGINEYAEQTGTKIESLIRIFRGNK